MEALGDIVHLEDPQGEVSAFLEPILGAVHAEIAKVEDSPVGCYVVDRRVRDLE